ncbi:hypothetical protein F5Y05DRAFT_408669 [Hypoxylon sp. FL0543]|nr:hypothetical protein F5Y05DRAFT_408669 [Hypoxylon sp. FL0543]
MVPKKREWMTGPTFSVEAMVDPALSVDDPAAATKAPKRKRASKPKVRTGCITCTGRKCDGYEGNAPPRQKKPPSPPAALASTIPTLPADPYLAKRHELARHSFAAACRGNSSLRILRPLVADIEGTEQERLFFHRFREAAEAGLAMHASSLGAGFWRRLVPQVGQSDPAVRHALIALGAAYESAQLQQDHQTARPGTSHDPRLGGSNSSRCGSPAAPIPQPQPPHQPYISTPPPDDNSNAQCIDQLELFMIQQYNMSIYHLQKHVQPTSPPESVEITLICCLVFVCIETSRGNEGAALAHVANGLQIIKALPPESEFAYSSGSGEDSTKTSSSKHSSSITTANGPSPRISRSDWQQLLDFFLALEPSAMTYGFSSSQPPTPPCPAVSTWENPLECWDEMLPQWEMQAAEMEI